MNWDNQRLKSIQLFKKARYAQLERAESEEEKQIIRLKIDSLEKEEHEILLRCDVL